MTYTLDSITPLICLRCIGGSRAYGLETPASDEDIKGVYLAPLPDVLTGEAPATVQDEKHDIQYTELGEFCRQLMLNNSGALELWACMGQEQELFCTPWLREFFANRPLLSKRCYGTYTQNALSQLKRIRTVHDKAVLRAPAPRVLADFAAVLEGGQSTPFFPWAEQRGLALTELAAASAGTANLWALYRHPSAHGLFGKDGMNVVTPVLPKDAPFLAYLSVDTESYRAHRRAVKQYREWQENRNAARLNTDEALPESEGNYDVKHMAHVFRLLHTAREIATEGRIHVRRTWDNSFLRDIRAGILPYSELCRKAEQEIAELKHLYDRSDLPDEPEQSEKLFRELAELRIRLHRA